MILQIHGIDTITIQSRRHLRRRNIAFYRDLLGLPLIYPLCDADVLVFELHQRKLAIELLERVEVNSNWVRATFEVDDLQEAYASLAQSGYEPVFSPGWSLATERVFALDPTGYRIELFKFWPA